jgi:hypothetical protein
VSATKARFWRCACGLRNSRRRTYCESCGKAGKPKLRVPKHAVALRDNDYAAFVAVNEQIHGAGESCGVCGKEPHELRHLDRDHGHNDAENSFGKPRGLACPGNQGCNALMPRQLTLERARLIVAYLERVEAHYAKEPE